MMIKTKDFRDFLELVHSSKNHKDDWAITLYSKNEVSPGISFTGDEPKLIRVRLVYCCSSFNLVFEKNFDKQEFENEYMESKILELKAMSVVKEFEKIHIDYSTQLVTVNDVHSDL